MRWIPFIALVWVAIILQITLVNLIRLPIESIGVVMPDLLAAIALFIALRGKKLTDVMIAAWILGIVVDLTTAGGAGRATVVGPMAIAYALPAMVIFKIREVFFRDWFISQVILGLFFTLQAHIIWVTWQSLTAGGAATWQHYGHLIIQAILIAAYTAAITPIIHMLLKPCQGLIFTTSAGRSSSRR